jgi:hypothetical protein
VFFRSLTLPAKVLAEKLGAAGVRVLAVGSQVLRAVTHLNISRQNIQATVEIFRQVLGPGSGRIVSTR